jgi:hypothetical protein
LAVKRGIKNWLRSAAKRHAEKIGTNRRLLDRKLIFDFVRPFDFVKKSRPCPSPPVRGRQQGTPLMILLYFFLFISYHHNKQVKDSLL